MMSIIHKKQLPSNGKINESAELIAGEGGTITATVLW